MTSRPSLADAGARPSGSVDPADVARFERLGADWWDDAGSMAPLHRINPQRVRFVRDTIVRQFGRTAGGDAPDGGRPLSGLAVLDIGCGGGLLAEPLARLGAAVTAIDPGADNIAVARAHAADLGVAVDYRATTAEALAGTDAFYDAVIASEVIEHATDQPGFTAAACAMVRPGGVFIASTLNRTAKSFLLAIVGAEYVLRWLPRGTHDWQKFVTPTELKVWTRRAGLRPLATRGLVFNPLRNDWSFGTDTDVNYFFAAAKPERPS